MDDVTKEEIIKEAIENAKKGKRKQDAKAVEDAPGKEAEEAENPSEDEKTQEAEASDGESDGSEAEASDGQGEKKGAVFQKKNKTDKYKEQISELEDKVKRQLAEFENFRNRTEKEKAQMYDMGAKGVLEKILPVIDNFERGLATVPAEEAQSAFAEGMNMIYKQLLTELEKIGVTPIEAVGTEFDPDRHNAVMQVESEEYESGFVAQEMQKGYMYRDTVLRHSMVAVVP